MFFQQDYETPEPELPKATGPRLFFRILGQETASLLLLNIIFLLSCLPVVTIPPALLALHQVVRRMLTGKAVRSWSQYWEAFRQGWKRAYGAFALIALPMAAAGYGAWFYLQLVSINPVGYLPFVFCAVVFLIALLASSYLYGLLADGRKLTKGTVLLALRLGLGKPLRTVMAAAGWFGMLAAGILWLPLSGAYLFLIGFSVPCLLRQFLTRTVLEKFGKME